VAQQSNATAAQLRAFMSTFSTQTRQGLQADLDAAVQQTADQSASAAAAARSTSVGPIGTDFATVFADRAQSMSELRTAVDGLLGMVPPPDPGSSAAESSTPGDGPAQLSANEAINRITAAGTLLAQADHLYVSVRHELAGAVGDGRLPKSVWVTDPGAWGPGNISAQIDVLATSPNLASTHYLELRTVRLTPPALPAAPGASAGVSVISPVTQLGVTVVLANNGSVTEPRATVRFTLANETSASRTSTTQSVTTALAAGASVTLPTVTFGVKPGTTYLLTVSAVLPAGQTVVPATLAQALEVAPAS
jgi:hypothetical protein